MAAYVLIGGLIFGAIGYFIGDKKGRAVLGLVLGFLLGIIGVIIIAIIPAVQTADSAVPAFTAGAGAGWFADPHRRHELRYYDGTNWTEHVSDNGAMSIDWMPPPPPVA